MAFFNDPVFDNFNISNLINGKSNEDSTDPCKKHDHCNVSAGNFIDENYDKVVLNNIENAYLILKEKSNLKIK